MLQKHSKVFEKGLGTLTGFQAKIVVDPSAQPKFCNAHIVPYFLRDNTENCLVDKGTLETVKVSKWASPIVSILKSISAYVVILNKLSILFPISNP